MCPMRILLVFFSATLAGYFAWRTYMSDDDEVDGIWVDSSPDGKSRDEQSFVEVVQKGLWVFVDMASGRYLWRNLKELRDSELVKSS